MSKPILTVTLITLEDKKAKVRAVLDTGSFHSIVREDCLPEGTPMMRHRIPQELRTAAKGGRLHAVATTHLTIVIGRRMIGDEVFVSPDLGRDMLIGAGMMQKWDVTIRNRNGHTTIHVGRDLRDPEISEVD